MTTNEKDMELVRLDEKAPNLDPILVVILRDFALQLGYLKKEEFAEKAPQVLWNNVARIVGLGYSRKSPKTDETLELVPAPEGVEFAMRIFIHCDAADLSHVLNFPGNRFVPPADDAVDVAELIDSLTPKERDFLKAVGSWRVMSREEITRYKRRMARLADEQARAGQLTPFRDN